MKGCFIDTETTGLDPAKCAVVQVGIVFCDITAFGVELLDTWKARMRPHEGAQIDDEALAVTNTTLEELEKRPDPKLVHQNLVKRLKQSVNPYNKKDKLWFLAYNAKFDADHMRAWFHRCGDPYFGSYFWTPAIDVMAFAALRLLEQRPQLENFKLATVSRALGIELDNAHDAVADCRAAAEIFRRCWAGPGA